MKHNLTLNDLNIDGWIAFSQAFRKAQEESFEKGCRIFATLKQPKEASERMLKLLSQAEIREHREFGYVFYSDPPIEINDKELKDFPWLMMAK